MKIKILKRFNFSKNKMAKILVLISLNKDLNLISNSIKRKFHNNKEIKLLIIIRV